MLQGDGGRLGVPQHLNEVPVWGTCQFLFLGWWWSGCRHVPGGLGVYKPPSGLFPGVICISVTMKAVGQQSSVQQDGPNQNCAWAMVCDAGRDFSPWLCLIL